MQKPIGIVENVPFGDGIVAIVVSEFCQGPISDVLTTVCAVLIVGVEGKNIVLFQMPNLC